MSVSLIAASGQELNINAWNWGVLHHLVERAALFPLERWEPMRYNAGGALTAVEVQRLADFLEANVLPLMSDGERMMLDGSVTDEPDDGTLYRDEAEMWKNYSLHRTVLVNVIVLLQGAGGEVEVL